MKFVAIGGESEQPEPKAEQDKPQRLACPKCGSVDTRPSRSAGVYGEFLAMLGRKPFRCRSCRVKFYRKPLP